ncbi:MAG: type VI secretion system tip protein VgrG [Phycisphaerae bacterium]|jgi:type VI secretion system secreted protein VgrG
MAEQPQRSASKADFLFRVADKTADLFKVVAFTGREEISQLFHFRVEVCTSDTDVAMEDVVGKACTLVITGQTGERYVNGIVRQFERLGEATHLIYYAVEIVPAHWLLTKRQQCRIFQKHNCSDMTAPGIIKKVFELAGITNDYFREATQGTYVEREYVVQYRESDFDFISRLMEEEGVFYFFEHTETGHKMVFGDGPTAHVAVPNSAEVTFREKLGMVSEEEKEFIHALRERMQVQTGKVSLDDFNFEKPGEDLLSSHAGDEYTALEYADYPGRFLEKADGKKLAEIRMQEFACRKHTYQMNGGIRALLPGFKFSLIEHPNQNYNQEYLVVSLSHRGFQPQSAEAEAGGARGMEYGVEIETILAAAPFRPARVTPKPVIYGTQTAMVCGPSGEEIFPDKYGRVKVQFHWDRQGQYDENSSCWIRVCQGLAGGQYGIMFLPRVGQEVVVDFLEGDPDRPLIVGRVFNNDLMPPYTLPDEKTKSTIKTHSSKGGGGTNEIRFEDKKGSEQLFLHAEKDLHIRSKADTVHTVGGNHHLDVGEAQKIKVGSSRGLSVGGDNSVSVGGKHSHKVTGNVMEEYGASQSTKVTGERYLKCSSFIVDASSAITLKVGGNFVVIDAAGVAIKGTLVMINSGGAAMPSTITDTLAGPASPDEADEATPGHDITYSATPGTETPLDIPTMPEPPEPEEPEPEEEQTWAEFQLLDDDNNPVADEPYRVVLGDGTERTGSTDGQGLVRIENVKAGTSIKISFPNRGDDEWEFERRIGPDAGATQTGGGTGTQTP